jgi:hypothetical protein
MPFQKGHKRHPGAGRQIGSVNKNTAALKALAMKPAPKVIAELERLALHATNEAVRVAACKELLDRAIGKAVQPHSGETGGGPVVVQDCGLSRAWHQAHSATLIPWQCCSCSQA